MTSGSPRILGLVPNLDFQVRKGSAFFNLFKALEKAGHLADLVDVRISRIARLGLTALNASPLRAQWRFNNLVDPRKYWLLSRNASGKVARMAADFDVMLQIGSEYRVPGNIRPGVRRYSYHDNNLYNFLTACPPKFARMKRSLRAAAHERAVYDGLDGVFTMSKTLRQSFIEDFGLPEEKVHYAGFGLSFVPDQQLDKDYGRKSILFVASHSFREKGGEVLLAAFSRLKKDFPDAELAIIGQSLNLDIPGVTCLGFLDKRDPDQLARYRQAYRDATLFVLPSFNEAFGEVFIEAMAHKAVCIGSDSSAMPELIVGNSAGRVIPPGDADALYKTLHELFSDESELARLATAGYRAACEEYSWDQVCRRVLATVRA